MKLWTTCRIRLDRTRCALGTDFLYNDDTITYPRSIRGSYSFSSLATFLSGTYNNSGFTQTFNNSVIPQTNPNVAVYAQDEWKASRRLTLNFGVRYDLQFLKTIATDTNNVSPRAGFAWTPFGAAEIRSSRQLRSFLRSRAASSAGKCAAVGEQHDRHRQLEPDQHQSLSDAKRGACFSRTSSAALRFRQVFCSTSPP